MFRSDPSNNIQNSVADRYVFTREASPPSSSLAPPGFEGLHQNDVTLPGASTVTSPPRKIVRIDSSYHPNGIATEQPDAELDQINLQYGVGNALQTKRPTGITAKELFALVDTKKRSSDVNLIKRISVIGKSRSSDSSQDAASCANRTLSSAVSSSSTEPLSLSIRSSSPFISEKEDSDARQVEHSVITTVQHDDERPSTKDLTDITTHIASPKSNDQSPSRRSARIVSSGSSVKEALKRRDELDDKLSGKRRRSASPSSSQAPIIPQQTPLKRGRGRPRKSALAVDLAETFATGSASQETPVRRGPGRPRKSAPVFDSIKTSPNVSLSQDLSTRRGPGRPRKSAPILVHSMVPAATSASQYSPIRRGPGRPRKSAPALISSKMPAKASTSAITPARRGPGRPRKSAPVFVPSRTSAMAHITVSEGSPLRRSPERPRKPDIVATAKSSTLVSQDTPVPRRPGRPRKSAPVLTQSIRPNLAASTTQHTLTGMTATRRSPERPRKPESTPVTVARHVPTPQFRNSASLSQDTPVKRGRGRPRKSLPSSFAPTGSPAASAVRAKIATPGSRKSVRLSTGPPEPKSDSAVPVSVLTPLALVQNFSKTSSPIKRGPGRPRKSAPNYTQTSTQMRVLLPSQSPPFPARSQTTSSILVDHNRVVAKKRSAPEDVPPETDLPKRKRGRPPGPERLRRLLEEEELAKSRNDLARLRAESASITDDSMSELTEVSEDTDDAVRGSLNFESGSASRKQRRLNRQDKDRKKYYVTGLYAGESVASNLNITQALESQNSSAFPFPMHFGSKLLTEERDYALPFYLHQESEQLHARAEARRKPPPYQQIRANKFTSRPKLQGEITVCYCKPPSNCGSDCMNRMTLFICDPKACPCGEACTNISLGKREAVKTAVAHYGGRGFGLKTLDPIGTGQFIDEYRGEVINLMEMTKRVNEEYMATGNFYLLEYDAAAGELLDGGRKGNITRFANHSCDPNCRIEKFTICGTDESLSAEFQIGLFALRDIGAGEELTYNYGWAAFQPRDINGVPTSEVPAMNCLCGASNCVGILGGKKLPPTKPSDNSSTRKKTRRKKRPQALTPKAAASLLAKVTQKQNEAGNSALSRKVGVRDTRHKKAETAVKLAVKVKLKRAVRTQPTVPTSRTPPAPSVQSRESPSLLDAGAESPVEEIRPVIRKRGRPPKYPKFPTVESSRMMDVASTSELAHKASMPGSNAGGDHRSSTRQQRPDGFDAASPSPLISRMGAEADNVPRASSKSPQKVGGGFKGLSYSAAAAVNSDDDDDGWHDSSESESEDAQSDTQQTLGDDTGTSNNADGEGKSKHPPQRGKRRYKKGERDSEVSLVERRARNAFLARVRRASKRGIIIEDPTQHPLKKISIQCTAAPENTYIPDLPSSLISLGMSTVDARRARNAFLARVRRGVKRGFSKEVAVQLAAKPLPGDPAYDTPVMHAQRAQLEQLQREAAAEFTADPSQLSNSVNGEDDAHSPIWEDMSS